LSGEEKDKFCPGGVPDAMIEETNAANSGGDEVFADIDDCYPSGGAPV